MANTLVPGSTADFWAQFGAPTTNGYPSLSTDATPTGLSSASQAMMTPGGPTPQPSLGPGWWGGTPSGPATATGGQFPVMPSGGGIWGAINRATNGGMPAPNSTMTPGGFAGSAFGSAFGGWGHNLASLGGAVAPAGSGGGARMGPAGMGETRLINGQPARWDGTGWLALNGGG